MAVESLDLLRSIDASLKDLLRIAKAMAPKEVASDADLNSQWGNPQIRFGKIRGWDGPSFKGAKMSECPPDYLELVADLFDYFATQSEAKGAMTDQGKPLAPYQRRDAARARGWARRNRQGGPTAPPPQTEGWASDGF